MRRSLFFVLPKATSLAFVLITLSSGCTNDADRSDVSQQGAIAGWRAEDDRPEVCGIYDQDSGKFRCSASLITKNTVLTANHCIHLNEVLFPPPVEIRCNSEVRNALWAARYGSRYGVNGNWVDIAVIRLSGEFSEITPVTLATQGPKGETNITLSGMGRHELIQGATSYCHTEVEGGEPGQVRSGENTVTRLYDSTFEYEATFDEILSGNKAVALRGDSGGPSFLGAYPGSMVQVGIHSSNGFLKDESDTECTGFFGEDVRVDVYRQWILDAASRNESPIVDEARHRCVHEATINKQVCLEGHQIFECNGDEDPQPISECPFGCVEFPQTRFTSCLNWITSDNYCAKNPSFIGIKCTNENGAFDFDKFQNLFATQCNRGALLNTTQCHFITESNVCNEEVAELCLQLSSP